MSEGIEFAKLVESARLALTDSLGVKKGETLVVVADPDQSQIGHAFYQGGRDLGLEAIYIEMLERSSHGEEPPEPVATAMCAADVFVAPAKKSLTHTRARAKAVAAGARGATLPAIKPETMVRTLGIDYREMERRTSSLAEALTKGDTVLLTSPAGTEIRFSISGRQGVADDGVYLKPGSFGNLPAGEAYIAPVEGSAEGTVVIDGSMAGIGKLETPIRIEFSGGYAADISGGAEASRLAEIIEPFGKFGRNLAELGIGTNDRAILTGSVLEDEKVMGTVHVAIGDNSTFGGTIEVASHLDGIIMSPTLVIDGRTVIQDGRILI